MTEHADKRASIRYRTLKKGKIVFRERYCSADCMVRNESETGALLLVTQNHIIPAEFELNVYPGTSYRPVQIVWRSPEALGVRFLDEAASAAPTMPKDAKLELHGPQPADPKMEAGAATAALPGVPPIEELGSDLAANPSGAQDHAFVPKDGSQHRAKPQSATLQADTADPSGDENTSGGQLLSEFLEKRVGRDRRIEERRQR